MKGSQIVASCKRRDEDDFSHVPLYVAEAIKPYGDLKARTKAYAIQVVHFFDGLPETRVCFRLGDQILRSGTSIGAHYREARRARSDAEFISKLEVLLQELDETEYWTEVLRDSGQKIDPAAAARILDETNQLMSIFVTAVKTVKMRKGTKK